MVNSNTEKYFGSLLFELGVFGFVRLLIVCSAGNQVTNAYRELIRVVFENVHAWNVDEWMCFLEIKRMRVQFAVTFLGTYSLRQSTILAVLAFCLNYIVVLLQTENYGTNSPGLSAEQNNTWNQTEG